MDNLVNAEIIADILLIIFGLLILFHIMVLSGRIPYNIVWAGKIKSRKELIKFESLSIIILLFAVGIILLKVEYLTIISNRLFIDILTWILFILFFLNTFGNLTAKNKFEKYAFGSVTILISLLLLLLAVD